MTAVANPPWTHMGYQRIAAARYDNGELRVRFEDGSSATLKATSVLPSGTSGVAWDALSVDPYEISVPTAGGPVEIPWSTIRALTDSQYSAHLANVAEQQARQIGLRIRELREQRQLSSKELASRAGISPQSLSRIEHGHHDVVFTTLQRILAAMGCHLEDLTVEPRAPVQLPAVLRRLAQVGLDPDFVTRRLGIPATGAALAAGPSTGTVVMRLLHRVSRIFDWSIPTILGSEPLTFDPAIARAGLFKRYGRAEEMHASAYTIYARYLALILCQALKSREEATISGDPEAVRRGVVSRYGSLTFAHLLRFAWDSGVPVLPLHDPGAFHGACWRIGGRPVIVLKHSSDSQSIWGFDLGHEWKHVADHLTEDHPTVIEDEELSPLIASNASDEEREARDFAGRLLLFGRAEELAEQCVSAAQGSVEQLKSAVRRVAEREHVPTDTLANYLAFRLSKQGINWWGVANHLQVTEPRPWQIARDVLLEHVDLERLQNEDRVLLLAALSDRDTEGEQ
jgi:transcriptional regulator with XRE-family HTH domain